MYTNILGGEANLSNEKHSKDRLTLLFIWNWKAFSPLALNNLLSLVIRLCTKHRDKAVFTLFMKVKF